MPLRSRSRPPPTGQPGPRSTPPLRERAARRHSPFPAARGISGCTAPPAPPRTDTRCGSSRYSPNNQPAEAGTLWIKDPGPSDGPSDGGPPRRPVLAPVGGGLARYLTSNFFLQILIDLGTAA